MDKIPPESISPVSSPVPEKEQEAGAGKWQLKDVQEQPSKPQERPPSEAGDKSLTETKVSVPAESSDEEEVKSKYEASAATPLATPGELTTDPETLKAAFWDLSWPDKPINQKGLAKVVKKIDTAIREFTAVTTDQEKAYGYFQQAVILQRSGQPERAGAALETALQLDPQTVKEQLELSRALLYFEKLPGTLEEALFQFQLINDHRKKRSLIASLKVLEFSAGLYPEFKIPAYPSYLPKLLYLLTAHCLVRKSFPEALYTNDLELSYLIPSPIFILEGGSTGDQLIAEQVLWSAMDAMAKQNKLRLPKCHGHGGLSEALYDCYSRIIVLLSVGDDDAPLREYLPSETLKSLRSRLGELKRVKYSEPITYTQAVGALLLAIAHQRRLLEVSSNKASADFYLKASKYPVFKELLENAAQQYEKVMCYREAAACLDALADELEDFPGDVEKLRERSADNLVRAGEYELFLREVEQLSLEETPDSGTLGKKKKKKKKRKKKDGASVFAAITQQIESSDEDTSKPDSQPVVEKKASVISDTVKSTPRVHPPDIPVMNDYRLWNASVRAALEQIYRARKSEDFILQRQVLNKAKGSLPNTPESYEIFIEAAWHHMNQIDLAKKDRVTLDESGTPAELEELCRQARIELATAFRRLTGLKITHAIKPEAMRQLLQKHYSGSSPVPEEEKRFRNSLRMIMSSFAHSYSYMADKHPEDRALGHCVREFYKLKNIADPDYYKPQPKSVATASKVKVISRKDFEVMRLALKS